MSTPTRKRTTYRPVSEHFTPPTVAGVRVRTTVNSNGIFALGAMAGVALAVIVSMFVLELAGDGAVVREGERVCVEYTDADGYFCGSVVFTAHDDIYRG